MPLFDVVLNRCLLRKTAASLSGQTAVPHYFNSTNDFVLVVVFVVECGGAECARRGSLRRQGDCGAASVVQVGRSHGSSGQGKATRTHSGFFFATDFSSLLL